MIQTESLLQEAIAGSNTKISKTHRLLNKMLLSLSLSLSLPFCLFTVAHASFAFLSGRLFSVLGHSIVNWGNDGTKITNLSVTFHWSFTTMWHHFKQQMQNFIDKFHVPSLVYGSLYMRNYQKTKSHNYPVDWGNVGTYQG